MPSGKVHVLGAVVVFIAAGLLIYKYLGFAIDVFTLPVFVLFALLPDLDIPNSTIAPKVKQFCLVGVIFGYVCLKYLKWNTWVAVFTVFCLFLLIGSIFTSHRKFFHSPVAAFILSAPLYFIGGFPWFISGFTGYLVHLAFDGELFQGGMTS
jgi:hypothetical protein